MPCLDAFEMKTMKVRYDRKVSGWLLTREWLLIFFSRRVRCRKISRLEFLNFFVILFVK